MPDRVYVVKRHNGTMWRNVRVFDNLDAAETYKADESRSGPLSIEQHILESEYEP